MLLFYIYPSLQYFDLPHILISDKHFLSEILIGIDKYSDKYWRRSAHTSSILIGRRMNKDVCTIIKDVCVQRRKYGTDVCVQYLCLCTRMSLSYVNARILCLAQNLKQATYFPIWFEYKITVWYIFMHTINKLRENSEHNIEFI